MSTPIIILVNPQLGENIGAAARVMSNFGLAELRLVAPRDGWPNTKALSMSAHGAFVLEQAKVYQTLEHCLADIQYLVATSANNRGIVKPIVSPSQGVQEIGTALTCNNKAAIMFGCERTGLTNEQLTLADAIITIHTSPRNPSLNLAQAVAVVAYEWSCSANSISKQEELYEVSPPPLASKGQLMQFFAHLESELELHAFFKVAAKKPRMAQNIRNIFSRTPLSSQELKTLHGIVKALVTSQSSNE